MAPSRTQILPVLALALAAAVAAPTQAGAATAAPVSSTSSKSTAMHFSAAMSGRNEVGTPGGPTAGDPNGSAKSEVEIEGDLVTFSFTWKKIQTPTMAHIHTGAAGVNGDVKVPLFTSAMPETTNGAAGVVSVSDPGLVAAIKAHPADFYVNLHTAQFPAGAVRGQLKPARRQRPALDLLKGLPLQTLLKPGAVVPVAGDPDGAGIAMVRASGHRVRYTLAWSGIGRPEMGHLHAGGTGVDGPDVVPLFTSAVPDHVFAISGLAPDLDKKLVTAIRHAPRSYYVNLHTPEFPDGAIRGQLYPAGHIGD